jgi:hypothetical protein
MEIEHKAATVSETGKHFEFESDEQRTLDILINETKNKYWPIIPVEREGHFYALEADTTNEAQQTFANPN